MSVLDSLKAFGHSAKVGFGFTESDEEKQRKTMLAMQFLQAQQALEHNKAAEGRASAAEKRTVLDFILKTQSEVSHNQALAEEGFMGPKDEQHPMGYNPEAFRQAETYQNPEIAASISQGTERETQAAMQHKVAMEQRAAEDQIAQRAREAEATRHNKTMEGTAAAREARMESSSKSAENEAKADKARRMAGKAAMQSVVAHFKDTNPDQGFTIGMRAQELIVDHGYKSPSNAIGKAFEEVTGRPRAELLGNLHTVGKEGTPGPDMAQPAPAPPAPGQPGAATSTQAGAQALAQLDEQVIRLLAARTPGTDPAWTPQLREYYIANKAKFLGGQ